jgi:hypothetical protein
MSCRRNAGLAVFAFSRCAPRLVEGEFDGADALMDPLNRASDPVGSERAGVRLDLQQDLASLLQR